MKCLKAQHTDIRILVLQVLDGISDYNISENNAYLLLRRLRPYNSRLQQREFYKHDETVFAIQSVT